MLGIQLKRAKLSPFFYFSVNVFLGEDGKKIDLSASFEHMRAK
jgi:hypothetical protein